ncbi:MAG: DMT family transporter [Oscillospiraceae bacterium]|nr:DMT family transporter [Oscillospiraceae bacterium]
MKKGVLAVVAASFLYGIMPIFTKRVLMEGMTSGSVVFYRLFFSAVFSFIFLMVTRTDIRIEAIQLVHLAVFGIIGFGATMALLTVAYSLIPTGLATMLHFTYPLFVTVVMTVVFREKMSRLKLISCLCALGGLALMADFSRLSVMGIVLAVCSGITYACYVIANRKSSFSNLPGMVIVFYVSCFAAVFFGIKAVIAKEFMLPKNGLCLCLLLIIAIFCTIITLFLLTYGIKTLGASTASVLNMLEPVISLIAGVIIYKESVTLFSIIGAVLVVAGGLAVALDSGNEQKVKVHINTQRYR